MEKTTEYKWPEDLKLNIKQKKALEAVPERYPALAEWPEDQKIMDAEQPKAMAMELIGVFHAELRNAKVAYLFRQSMGSSMRTVWAKASKSSGREHHLSGYDFVLVFNWSMWRDLNVPQRAALVDHELEHCGMGDEGEYQAVAHDLEEFNTIVRRWGLWRSSLANFVEAARPQMELELKK